MIMITTKKGGRGNGPQVTYNGYTTFDFPTRTLKPLSAEGLCKTQQGFRFWRQNRLGKGDQPGCRIFAQA